jgi:transcriptional regulator with XRE-family HTH domain
VERSLYPNLKLTMYRTGVRQNLLAKTIGIHEAHLSRIINGTRRPGPEVREQIASVLRENVEWLFELSRVEEEVPAIAGMER